MMTHKIFLVLLSLMGCAVCCQQALATGPMVVGDSGITNDGSVGSFSSIPLDLYDNGYIYIDAGVGFTPGELQGGNVFFSFSQFNLSSGQTALFSCSACSSFGASNVITRVTGSSSSTIDGTIRSNISAANFWFFNPNGIIFGPNAVIDVPSAFHFGTASQVNFTDGSSWTTDTGASSSLSSAQPSAFGFSGTTGDIALNGANITVNNTSSELASGNNLTMTGATTTGSTLTISAKNNISLDSSSSTNANITAGTDLNNSGKINTSKLTVGQDLTNNGSNAQINLNQTSGDISVGRDFSMTNGGQLTASNSGNTTITTTRDFSAQNATLNFNNSGTANLTVGRNLAITQNASLNFTNPGTANVTAGSDISINTNGKVLADNTGSNAFTISAGTLNNDNVLSSSSTGGSLKIESGGSITKNTGSGDLNLMAKRAGSNGGQFVLDGNNSNVTVGHSGNLMIYPNALYTGSSITNPALFSFSVSNGATINKNNSGSMNVTAQTVYLSGGYLSGSNAIKGTTSGNIIFNAVPNSEMNNTDNTTRYFKMFNAEMSNVGEITISDYFLDLDPSGIQSDTAINLAIYNTADMVLPNVLVGFNIKGSAKGSLINFLDAPNLKLNKLTSLNPALNTTTQSSEQQSNTTFIRNITLENTQEQAAWSGNIFTAMTKAYVSDNPCEGSKNQTSTLNTHSLNPYKPSIGAQVPYSLLSTTDPSIHADTAALQLTLLNNGVNCQ